MTLNAFSKIFFLSIHNTNVFSNEAYHSMKYSYDSLCFLRNYNSRYKIQKSRNKFENYFFLKFAFLEK